METKVKSVKTKKNSILKQFIIEKYGSISKFTKKEKVPRGDVEIILNKEAIFNEMNIGMKVCKALDIDAEELFCKGNIRTSDDLADLKNVIGEENAKDLKDYSNEINTINNNTLSDMPSDEEIRAKCKKLGGAEQQRILDFINSILDN